MPSIVTCCSCMHSRSADCVFGDARLISSTSSRFVNTGPGLNSNSFERWLKTLTPVTSEGSRSGVNCRRENETSSERASAFASIVLPTPGKSSRIRCPSLTRLSTQSRSVLSGACTTRARLSVTACIVSAAVALSTRCLPGSLTQELLCSVDDRRGDAVLRCLGDPLLACGGQQYHLVVIRVETDVVARDVVEHNEIDALALELLARARETFVATVGRKADEHLAVEAPRRERAQDVSGRLELDVPRLGALRALGFGRLSGP